MQPAAFELEKNSAVLLLQALSCLLKEEDAQRVDLAHLLHKDMAGGLVACSSLGEMMRHELANDGDPASVARLLASLDATLRQTLQLVREMTEKQFPPVLKAFGLHVALQQLVRNIGENFAGSVVLHINGDEPAFDLASRLNLFRIMQALLKHCVRFANTSWVEVTCALLLKSWKSPSITMGVTASGRTQWQARKWPSLKLAARCSDPACRSWVPAREATPEFT